MDSRQQPAIRNSEHPADFSVDAADPNPPNTVSSNQYLHRLPKIISFDSLARCGEEVWIENRGAIYRLRRTRQGKLILTK